MIIYKMTHLPTGKYYIGSLQRTKLWHRYKTSSKIVKSMMQAKPEEWKKEILKQYPDHYDPQLLVSEEYTLIDEAVKQVGWTGIWNLRGSTNLGSSGYSPEAREKQKASAKNPVVIAKAKISKTAFINANPDYYERISNTAKATWNTPEMKKLASQRATFQFSNDENRQLASNLKKEYLAKNPQDIVKSLDGMKKAREDSEKEALRITKIKTTMSSKSQEFSLREKLRHITDPNIGKKHGELLKSLNQSDPSRKKRMSESAKKKVLERPDLVAKSVQAMNTGESRAKMKASLLSKYGKWVEITFVDGEKLLLRGAKEAGRILGIDKVSRKVKQLGFRKPLYCTSDHYLGREIMSLKYIDIE